MEISRSSFFEEGQAANFVVKIRQIAYESVEFGSLHIYEDQTPCR
jgi:hypothetical protein